MFIRSHNRILFTKLQLLKILKKTLQLYFLCRLLTQDLKRPRKEIFTHGKLYLSCQLSNLLVLLIWDWTKLFCPEKEWWSLYSFLGLTWTSQHYVNQFLLCSFQTGDLILLVFDERYENYLVLSTGQTLFFLHPDSMTGLDIATSECSNNALS